MSTTRYILLPRGRLKTDKMAGDLLRHLHDQANVGGELIKAAVMPELPNLPFRLVDSMHENGPKLTDMDHTTAEAINRGASPLRAIPEIIYGPPKPPGPIMPSALTPPGGGAITVVVHCTDSKTGAALAGMDVRCFDNFAARTGGSGITNPAGDVTLSLASPTIDHLYVIPSGNYWGAFRQNLPFTSPINLALEGFSPAYVDSIRRVYPTPKFISTTGVRVGIIDTGSGPHSDLNIAFGQCTVTGQPTANYQDVDEHGTHVAGLVGGTGALGSATRGLAPGVPLYIFRVFDYNNGKLGASNYAILKAMILAGAQGCDILNLSLGGGPYDPIVEESIDDARNQGMLVVVAAGNDNRGAVSFPAAYAGATAISAMGHVGDFPGGSYFDADVQRPPYGNPDANDFLASFSNVGPQVGCTGLGSGVLSTLPGNRIGPMNGTSMASPMVAGAAAALLSNSPAVFAMARDRARSNAFEKLLQSNCIKRFGGGIWEGFGLPDPAVV